MMRDPAAVALGVEILRPSSFTSSLLATIFDTIRDLCLRKEPVEIVTVVSTLRAKGRLDDIGGASYVQTLFDEIVVNPLAPIRLVADVEKRRRVCEALARATAKVKAGADSTSVLSDLRETLEATRSSSRPIEAIDLDEIAETGIEPIPWILDGWLAADDVAMIAGRASGGKSTLAYDLADAISRGRSWCGIPPSEASRVLIVDEEQGARAAARLAMRIGQPYGPPSPNLRIISGQGIRLNTREEVARLEGEIRTYRPAVVILDSVQTIFAIPDDNASALVAPVYAELFRLRDTYRVAFVLLHHKRKSGPGPVSQDLIELVRGTTAHGTSCSTVWYMSRSGSSSAEVRQAKRRESTELAMRVGYEAEDPDGPIVLSSLGDIEDQETEMARAIDWIGRYVTDQGRARTKEIREAGAAEGYTRKTVDRALSALVSSKLLLRPARGVYESPACPQLVPSLSLSGSSEDAQEGLMSSGRDT